MGRIYTRNNNKGESIWYVDYTYQGVRKRQRIGKSKQIARLALADIELRIARGEWNLSKPDADVDDFLKEFDKFSKVNHAPSSYVRYRNIIQNFKSFLKRQRLSNNLGDLNPKIFEDYKVLRRTVPLHKNIIAKSNTVNMEIKTLRTILNYAVKWGFLKKNPTEGVAKLKVLDAKTPRFLSKEEIKSLLLNCGASLYPIFFLLLNTGMRSGELRHLTWNDIDLENKRIHIQWKEFWSPKTGERIIPMSNSVFECFVKLRAVAGADDTFVFPSKSGGPMSMKLRERLITVTKRSGFPDVTKVHTLRHTFASHLIMSGVDLPTVQKLLGHSDIQTTMIYSHLAPEHISSAISNFSLSD